MNKIYDCGHGQPIMFLPGASLNPGDYIETLQSLTKNHRVLIPNTNLDHPDSILKFISDQQLKHIILVGHSFGGLVAASLSISNQNISKLILIDPAGIPVNYSKLKFFYLLSQKTQKEFFDNPKITAKLLKSSLANIFHTPSILNTAYYSISTAFSFQQIKQPTLILWGKDDEILPPSQAEIIHRQIQNSKIKFIDGNHDWCIFQPKIFSNIIQDFLNEAA